MIFFTLTYNISDIFYFSSLAGMKGTGFTYLGEFHTNESRSRHLAFLSSFISFTMFLLPLVGSLLLTQSFELKLLSFIIRPWRLFILVGSLISTIAAICFMLLPESPKFLQVTGREGESLAVLENIFKSNNQGEMKMVCIKYYFLF